MFQVGKKWPNLCIVIISLAVAPVLSADSIASINPSVDSTGDQSVRDLDRMVITATRTPKKQENVPAIVTVIHNEEIEQTPAQTVGDLLGTLPGVKASEPQGVGMVTPQTLKVRGNGFGHALVLLDGQPINTPYTGYAYMTTIPVRAIKNIEIVRGAYSALYGSCAGGGIVNITTKDGSNGNYVQPWGRLGDFGRYDFGCDLGLSIGDFSIGAFYDHKNVDNFYLYDDHGADTVNYDHQHDRLHTNLRYEPSDRININLSGGFTQGETGFGEGSNLQVDNHQDVMHPYVNLRGTVSPTDRLGIRGQIDWIRSHHVYHGETLEQIVRPQFGPPQFIYKESLNDTRADRFRGTVDASYSFSNEHILTGGIEGTLNSAVKDIRDADADTLLNVQGRAGKTGEDSDYLASVFAQYDGTFWERLELVVGGRLDYYGDWGMEFSPKAAVRFRVLESKGAVDNFDAKISAGRGFRAPSLSELHSPPWSIAPFIVYNGNPDLLPEELWAIEGALEGQFLDRLLFCRIAPYVTFAENLITSSRSPDPYNTGGQIMKPENVQEVTIKGVDVELSSCIRISGLSLELRPFISFNFNRTVDDETDEVLDGYPLYSGAAGLTPTFTVGDFRIFCTWNSTYTHTWTSTSWGNPPVIDTVGGFFLHNARIGVIWNDFITVSADINNILNERSLIGIDSYLSERNAIAEVSVKVPLDGKWPWLKK